MEKSVTGRRDRGRISESLPERCRCKCSTVCLISGPASIKAGSKAKSYTLDVTTALNKGCRPSSDNHKSTEWKVGGQRKNAVKLIQPKKKNVKVKVAAGTAAGTFTLTATPTTTATCKGTNAKVNCSVTPDTVTIGVTN
jgi:hypothetical protein